ncbi:MAG TPA: fatty acid desaturase CarF family protein [Oligoflexus sp.]|uniref:fatty acid desaturase CarF family protein n=1 Tax=Oligoflexus sp. TaxID=1971216 RepID=UPI002D32B9DD|nr:fatty acid desaturase CarF family protein [Oligoflexus sp.]HYX39731.1 fatty acid desaturase CarF family protein [Oligoflexus sp.]
MLVRGLESLGLIGFPCLLGWAFLRLFSHNPLESLGWMILALPCAYYLADLFTGLVHWVCDSFGCETTPLWGPMLVGPFRRHHRDPLEITRISLIENLGASAIAGSVVLALIHPQKGDQGFLWHLWLWFLFFGFLSNLFHRWSHWPRTHKPRWLVLLQNMRLVLPSEAHLVHHRPPFRVNYCILCGWANGLTNRVPWARIEAVLLRLGLPTNFD